MADALDAIPDELAQLMDNVVVLVDDIADEPGLLGLYEGIPLTERDDYGGFAMPDQVTVYRLALCAMCSSEPDLVDQVTITVPEGVHAGEDFNHFVPHETFLRSEQEQQE